MSLSWRVSLFFLGALALVLAGFSASLYLLAQWRLGRQADDRLAAALDVLAAAAEVGPDGVEWDPHEHPLNVGGENAPDAVRWEVRDGAGRLLDRSANLGPGDLWPGGPPESSPGGDAVGRADRDGRPWRLLRRRLRRVGDAESPVAPDKYAALELTAGASLAPIDETLRLLAVTLIGLSAGLWLAAATAGRWACRWALAPVARLAAAARSTDATRLGLSLPSPGTRDELDDLSRAFNGLLGRLGEAFERQRRFTGDASHQLRTPLTALLGQVEVALRRDRPADEYRRVLSQVHGQAENLRRIVEALLFLARADAEARPPGMEAVDLRPWVAEQVGRWAGHDRAADLRLERPQGGPLWVRAQPALLGILLDNLLDNALKYGEAGAPVTVSARRERDAVVLAVQDAGHGIGPADLPHVFEPFYRSPEARRLGRGGVGLGLAVAHRVATAFGGGLVAESEPGRGSRFTLRLPAAEVAAPDSAPAGAS